MDIDWIKKHNKKYLNKNNMQWMSIIQTMSHLANRLKLEQVFNLNNTTLTKMYVINRSKLSIWNVIIVSLSLEKWGIFYE